jgi:hypothetical protein
MTTVSRRSIGLSARHSPSIAMRFVVCSVAPGFINRLASEELRRDVAVCANDRGGLCQRLGDSHL